MNGNGHRSGNQGPAKDGEYLHYVSATTAEEGAAPLHILIVDDDEHIREVCRTVAESSGMHVMDVSTAEEAIELLEISSVDVLLTQDRVMGADSDRLPLAKDISRIVAIPVECKTQTHAVLLAGLPRGHDALEMLERLELRALLVGQVMEVQHLVEAELRAKSWQTALLDSSVESVSIVDRNGFLLGMSRGARELLRETENRAEKTAGLKRFAELFRPRDWEEISGWLDRALAGSIAGSPKPLQTELPRPGRRGICSP